MRLSMSSICLTGKNQDAVTRLRSVDKPSALFEEGKMFEGPCF